MTRHDPSSAPRRPRILVIDDEKLVGSLLARFMRQDYDVTAIDDGQEALARMEAERFDVILTDLNMPGLSGVDIVTAARALEPPTPVILMSGYNASEKRDEVLEAGAAGYLEKPFNSKAYVLAYVQQILDETS